MVVCDYYQHKEEMKKMKKLKKKNKKNKIVETYKENIWPINHFEKPLMCICILLFIGRLVVVSVDVVKLKTMNRWALCFVVCTTHNFLSKIVGDKANPARDRHVDRDMETGNMNEVMGTPYSNNNQMILHVYDE